MSSVYTKKQEIVKILEFLTNAISYFGKNRTAGNARLLFALSFDLDEVGYKEFDSFFGFHVYHNHYPRPTYIVNSGGGVHLYYVLKRPLPMTPKNHKALKKIKYALTKRMDIGDWLDTPIQTKSRGYGGMSMS